MTTAHVDRAKQRIAEQIAGHVDANVYNDAAVLASLLIRGRAFCGEDARRKRTGRPRKISTKSFFHSPPRYGMAKRTERYTRVCDRETRGQPRPAARMPRHRSRSRARQCRRARSCRIGADISASIRAYLRASIAIACRRELCGTFTARSLVSKPALVLLATAPHGLTVATGSSQAHLLSRGSFRHAKRDIACAAQAALS